MELQKIHFIFCKMMTKTLILFFLKVDFLHNKEPETSGLKFYLAYEEFSCVVS